MSVLYNELNRLEEKEQKQAQPLQGLAKGKLDLDLPEEIVNDFYDLKEYIRISSRRSSRRTLAFASPTDATSSAMIAAYVGYLLSGASMRSQRAKTVTPIGKDKSVSAKSDQSFFKEGFKQEFSEKHDVQNTETENLTRVLIVDTNMHHPSVHSYLNMKVTEGLGDILEQDFQWRRMIKKVAGSKLDVMTAGSANTPAAELLSSDDFVGLINELQKSYRYVLFSAPPVLCHSEALSITALADGTVMVVQAGMTRWEEAQMAKRKLLTAHANLLGVVLDRQKNK